MTPIIRTLAGDIAPADLGLTLCHEHLLTRAPADIEAHDRDLSFGTVEGARQELEAFAAAGGRALIEMTTSDYGRDAAGVLRAAEGTGVHVIQATGLQKGTTFPPAVADAGVAELAAVMVGDVCDGIDGAGRAGVLKAGTCGLETMRDDERRVFAAVAQAHLETGAPISTHLQAGTLGHTQLDALAEDGVAPDRVLLGHLDRNLDWDYHLSLAERGCWLGYDHVTKHKYASDDRRAEFISRLLDLGHDRILVSGDLGRGSYQPAYGGTPGFTGVLGRLRELLDDAVVQRLTVDNPARFFAFSA